MFHLQITGSSDAVQWSYRPALVVLSLFIAALAALTAFAVVDRARAAGTRSPVGRLAWITYGAVGMGFGVWGMHFTGMLAVRLPVPVSYGLGITLLSLVVAVLGGGAALYVLSAKEVGNGRLQGAALILAASVGTMHYTGMEALRAPLIMKYDIRLFVLSLVIAYVLAAVALYTRFALQRRGARTTDRGIHLRYAAASAITAGLSVAGMHYTAMAATRFYAALGVAERGVEISATWMALAVATVAILIVGLTLLLVYLDARLSQASRSAEDADTRHRAIVASMADGLITFDGTGTIEAANPAAQRTLARSCSAIVGASITDFLPDLNLEVLPALEGGRPGGEGVSEEMRARGPEGRAMPVEVSITRMVIGGTVRYNAVFRDITERRKTEMGLKRLATAVEQASESVVVADARGIVQFVNPAFTRASGLSAAEVLGTPMVEIAGLMDNPGVGEEIAQSLTRGEVWSGRVITRRKDGSLMEGDGTVSPVRDPSGRITNSVAVFRDVTERGILERQLLNVQKLEAIGQLAAGIAHEINTPTQYVGDNTRFLADAFKELAPALELVSSMTNDSSDHGLPTLPEWARQVVERADIEFHLDEIPRAIAQSLEGISRVATIVRSMKEFSHPGDEKTLFDLNRAIESTVTVATNEWKYVADVELHLDPNLPPVPLLPGEFNQVILNLIVNAAHAIGEAIESRPGDRGLIVIRTQVDADHVEVRVEDTGTGIPPEMLERIFDPFFTTKEVGKGTGQGLSIAHSVIVKKHGGSLRVESSPGEGACFIIRLPLVESAEAGPLGGGERVA